jgi:hypothetical protein
LKTKGGGVENASLFQKQAGWNGKKFVVLGEEKEGKEKPFEERQTKWRVMEQ